MVLLVHMVAITSSSHLFFPHAHQILMHMWKLVM